MKNLNICYWQFIVQLWCFFGKYILHHGLMRHIFLVFYVKFKPIQRKNPDYNRINQYSVDFSIIYWFILVVLFRDDYVRKLIKGYDGGLVCDRDRAKCEIHLLSCKRRQVSRKSTALECSVGLRLCGGLQRSLRNAAEPHRWSRCLPSWLYRQTRSRSYLRQHSTRTLQHRRQHRTSLPR